MRLFVGIELPPETRSEVDAAAAELRTRLSRTSPKLDARWVDSNKLHVTLWFLGEVADDRLPAVIAALDKPFQTSAFSLRLAGVGALPASGPARVIWMGVPEGGVELRFAHAQIAERLGPLGFESDRKGYTAHLTIGRVRDPRSARGRALRETLRGAPSAV